jgi:heavy metal sensor kinase
MRRPSYRFKIGLWYMLVLALMLVLFSFLLHSYLKRQLVADLDDLLLSRVEGIIHSIDAYWEAEKIDAIRDGARDFVFSKIDNKNFTRVARFCLQEKSDDPSLLNSSLQVFNVHGGMIASVNDIPGIPGILHGLRQVQRPGQKDYSDLLVSAPGKSPEPARALVVSVHEHSSLAYFVRIISPLTEIDQTLSELLMAMGLLLPTIVVLTGIAGMFLARTSMRPVEAIIDTAARINAENLKLRVPVPATHDEISRLAETFNRMLENVDNSFSQQQRLIQDVSHELRTPLTILKGELEVALKSLRSAREYEAVLQSNLEEINHIERLVENLLTLARFENRQAVLDKKEFDLAALLRSVGDDMRILARQKQVTMDLRLPATLAVLGDENQLAQVFFNLLDNALKYTDPGGLVTVELRRQDGDCIVTVADNGMGMDAAELPLIFDRFYRCDKSRGRGGYGLGLSIARSLVEAHGGGIAVTSQPGRGATLTVRLPLAGS